MIMKIHLNSLRRPKFVERRGTLGICMHAFMHLCYFLDPTHHKMYPQNWWKKTTGHVCSSEENVLRCPLFVHYFLARKLSSAPVNQFNLSFMSQRLNAHCIQEEMNTMRSRKEGEDVERWVDFKCGTE